MVEEEVKFMKGSNNSATIPHIMNNFQLTLLEEKRLFALFDELDLPLRRGKEVKIEWKASVCGSGWLR